MSALPEWMLRSLGLTPQRTDRKIECSTAVIPYAHIHLEWWRPHDGTLNFGDALSYVVVTKILADLGYTLMDGVIEKARMLGIGSILHLARDGDVVWGAGANGKIPPDRHSFKRLDVRAVRGPLTKRFLEERGIEVPSVFGDPALLLPLLFGSRFERRSRRKFVVVPNLNDMARVSGLDNVIPPTLPWNVCVRHILDADFVISGSLHGLVVAEAFGIPARHLRVSDVEHPFKYKDYYSGTGRGEIPSASNIDEALRLGGAPPPIFDQAKLLSTFPLDLWSAGYEGDVPR